MKSGIEYIAEERQRQVSEEGWTKEHDDKHTDRSLAMAAALYATPERLYRVNVREYVITAKDPWPWHDLIEPPRGGHFISIPAWDKRIKHSEFRRLQIAGALIAAELDRKIRAGEGPDDE